MFDIIGLIASILGIIGSIIAFVQFVLKPHFKQKQQYKEIRSIVENCFNRWKELNYTIRGGSMIERENFLIVNKFRSKFIKLNDEMNAFLLRNAIQNGLSGDWGYWLNVNKDNNKIILPLIISLDESAGLRPVWRSSFILENLFRNSQTSIRSYIPDSIIENPKIKATIKIIEQNATRKELNKTIKNGSSENRKNAQMMIEEIEIFSEKINKFQNEQTIIKASC